MGTAICNAATLVLVLTCKKGVHRVLVESKSTAKENLGHTVKPEEILDLYRQITDDSKK
jgi:hypothetical protein